MGQQQLLLVILVTIIVGIATVVAINTFSSAADSANVDAARQDALSIAAAAQQYYMKPAALGGGNQDFTGMTFQDIGGVPVEMENPTGTPTQAHNQNGTYVLGGGSTSSIVLTVYPSSCYAAGNSAPNASCENTNDVLTATIEANGMSWTN
ncbi:hypothetical protein [Fodinibius sp.]|uniref:hypothetical protein n=1 Tax=Fodinibius sp. TaxID=1872440 RepID=UPI002ACE9844|nr:hypothetical protein [Fodinibius sp.]MDZ7660303.1 hypothetical protein [Fodinibius sp.]